MSVNIFEYKDMGDIKAVVDLEKCDGCVFCMDICPFKAISLVTEKASEKSTHDRHIVIDESLCQGCGLCQGTCPKDSVHVQGFSTEEISQKIAHLLSL